MRLLAVDLETTGTETASCRITEIAGALYCSARRSVLSTLSLMIDVPSSVPYPENVQKLTGITSADLSEFGEDLPNALLQLGNLCSIHRVERLVGHNSRGFDAEVLRAEIARLVAPPPEILLLTKLPWIDTIEDLPLPDETTSRRLGHLAADHGLPPSPWAHRALFDALQSLRLLECYPLDEVLRRADSPTVTVYAHQLPFERRAEASKLRFRWSPETHGKVWFKEVKEIDLDKLKAVVTFDIRVASTPKARVAA